MIASLAQHAVRVVDTGIARAYLSFFRERNALLPVLFHSLFRNEAEIAQNAVDPLDRTTIAHFRQLIQYFVGEGYRFASPLDLQRGLDPAHRYVMLTFDDGYFNNTLALPVLEEFNVPALFFISTNHIRDAKCFWWDVLYRELVAQGISPGKIYQEAVAMKDKRTAEIEKILRKRFGPEALVPRGDIDRPFRRDELRHFAEHPCVHLGNHTADHAILTNYTADEQREQIVTAQRWLRDVTGKSPSAIAYPNGGHDDTVIAISREAGLKFGFTVRPGKTRLNGGGPPDDSLRIGRFVPHAHATMASQCRTYRSDVLLYGMFRSIYLRLARGKKAQ